VNYIFSKFLPVLERRADRIIHVDCDTLFTRRVDWSPLFAHSISLVDSNGFRRKPLPLSLRRGKWVPSRAERELFHIPRLMWPVAVWLNSGVFAVRNEAIDLCRDAIRACTEHLELAIAAGVHRNRDELILNAMALKHRRTVGVVPDFTYNFLAYDLERDPLWPQRARVIHFHAYKPHLFRHENGAALLQSERVHSITGVTPPGRNWHFELAAMAWFVFCHHANRDGALGPPTESLIPLDVARRRIGELTARLKVPALDWLP
jgi:hypothetical protein